ncbi:uncharacterized protein LOC108908599 [Anoplophora glabripennis]|nr:uncharacterized protein LOC108908599 [Anoplophora glabripennis]
MALRLGFVVLAAFVVFQALTWESQASVVRRAAPSDEKNASQTIDDAIHSFKTGLDDLVKNIQGNELFRNVSETLQQFGQTVQQQGKDLIQKIQTDGQTRV